VIILPGDHCDDGQNASARRAEVLSDLQILVVVVNPLQRVVCVGTSVLFWVVPHVKDPVRDIQLR
jgi:hypothetical protein